MRTKTLLLSAVLGIAGAASVSAQNAVYSVNAVGYVNLVLNPGFNLIGVPLNANTNTIANLFANAPENSEIFRYTANGFTRAKLEQNDEGVLSWGTRANDVINPGEGFFFRNPRTTAFTNTFVGEVPQGTLNNPIPAGFSLKSSIVPQEGRLDTTLQFPVRENDEIYRFVGGSYQRSKYEQNDEGQLNWTVVPNIKVGEGFWVRTSQARTWTRTFSVNS
jgi:hypothetical protein